MRGNIFRLLLFLLFATSSAAQTSGTFDLARNVIAGGGGASSATGSFAVESTIGQALAQTLI